MTHFGPNPCRWCGDPATLQREVEPAKLAPKTKRVIKPALTAWVCDQHSAMFDREHQRAELRKRIASAESRSRRGLGVNQNELDYDRATLRELSEALEARP